MNNTHTQCTPRNENPVACEAVLLPPSASCPKAPSRAEQVFRNVTITRRVLPDQAALLTPAVADLEAAPDILALPHGRSALACFQAAEGWRDERARAEAWLDFVMAGHGYALDRAMDQLSMLKKEEAGLLLISPDLIGRHPSLTRLFRVREEATRRGIARGKASKQKEGEAKKPAV